MYLISRVNCTRLTIEIIRKSTNNLSELQFTGVRTKNQRYSRNNMLPDTIVSRGIIFFGNKHDSWKEIARFD